MSIQNYIKSVLKDVAVYWSKPVAGADGSNTFAAPCEIKCFWDNGSFLYLTNTGKEVMIRATVHVAVDLDEQGMLFHGRLSDLTSIQKSNPKKVSRAYEIKRFIKTPSLAQKNQFNRVAMTAYENK